MIGLVSPALFFKKMSLKEVNIEEDDFDVFLVLTPEEKIEYLWDAQSMGSTAAILKQIDKLDIFDRREPADPLMSTQEIISGDFRLTEQHSTNLYI